MESKSESGGMFNKTPDELRGLALKVASMCGFLGFNIALNEYNSFVLKRPPALPGFDFPVFYTMFHMIASVLGVSLIMCIKPPETGWPSVQQFWQYRYALFLNSACSTLNIALNNVSLTLISLFLNQVIKATGPAPTMLFSVLFQGKKYGWPMIISCALIIAGTIIAVPMQSTPGQTTQLSGVIFVITSTLAASLKGVVMAIVMKGTDERPKLSPTAVLWYDCFLAFWMMVIYWLVSAERADSIAYFGLHPGWAVCIILGGSSMAFGFNLSNYFFILSTSPLTVTVCSNGVKVIVLIISAIQDSLSSVQQWCGVSLTACSIVMYAFFSHQARGKQPNPLWPPFAKHTADDVEAKAIGETTPLKTDDTSSTSCCTIM